MPNRSISLALPDFDLAAVAVTASAWHVAVGQRVVEGDRVLEVAAGDVTVDLSAPATGVLVERCVAIDEPLQVGQLLARIRAE